MFGIFKRKKIVMKYLVGKVNACYKSANTSIRGEFTYNLFTDSKNKRSYEIEIISNHQMLYKYYCERNYSGVSNRMSYHELLATQHKHWHTIVQPWLSGGDLHPKYHVDINNQTRYISKALKEEIRQIVNSVIVDGSKSIDQVSKIQDLIDAATEA